MSSPYFQPVSAAGAPDQLTPADSPSSPPDFAAVTPHGRGPAGYDIQAQMPDLASPFAESVAVAGAGVLYPQGPRQAQAQTLLSSPQGFALDGYDIDAGFHGGQGGDPGWPADVEPPEAPAATPDQGQGGFTGTGTD